MTIGLQSSGLLGSCLVCGLLAGCSTLFPTESRLMGDLISGRISVVVESVDGAAPKAMNAAFELEGTAANGRLNLATPMGTRLAEVRWAPGRASLATPQIQTEFSDLDSLTAELLGESLPVGALFDWLRGRPSIAAPSEPVQPPADAGFRQLGWSVNLASFQEALVTARRERAPLVTVRAKMDRP